MVERTAGGAAGKAEHRIGRLEDFFSDKIVAVEVEGRTIGVVRDGDTVHAFANRCPHHGAPMCFGKVSGAMLPSKPDEYEYAMEGLIVKCPWHAYEFNVRTGDSVGGVMQTRLGIYHTEVRDGEVFCQLRRANPSSKQD